ncbi:polymorphic toxin-type HINT domain-containing protein [Streptomyces sp. NPDC127114]|uniref:polymorphic toxin-type HINT domain-containing protein n=1 Tax=Streptomyces sp. NPDC127114 TaxID=3345366 RepID=UPI003642B298
MFGTKQVLPTRSWRKARRRRIAAVALPVTTAIITTLLGAAPVQEFERDHTPLQKAQFGRAETFQPRKSTSADPVRAAEAKTRKRAQTKVVWPTAASARVTLPPTTGKHVKAQGLPVELAKPAPARPSAPKSARAATAKTPPLPAAPQAAKVQVADRKTTEKLGIQGVVLSVARADGKTDTSQLDLTVDYKGFAGAYSGNWSSRLRMVQLPTCALTTPDKPACRTTTPVPSQNNTEDQSVSAEVTTPKTASALSAFTVLALSAGASSDQGSYEATPLSPSATWAGGGSNGDFTWSYPMDVVPAPAGPAPSPSIGYSAQSVDGRTSATSAQPSWVGEGFDLPTSYIERSYGSCDDDGQEGKGDLCWREHNASIVLNGKSSTLVKDQTSGEWHLQSDDGERVIRGTGAKNPDEGDADDTGEYWTVTTIDGTQYVFGKNQLPGWTSGKPETNSVWTVPVFGDDAGEPGYSAGTSFSGRAKNQAWRWNLDYVVDPHGNVMTYWYDKELNYYAKNSSTGNGTEYTRGGYLKRIDYGQSTDTIFSTTQPAAARVKFGVAERCIPVTGGETCTNLTSTNQTAWPDVPFDQICKKDTVCTDQPTPSFFTRKRLTDITTQVYKGTGTGADTDYRDVNNWHLEHSFPDPGDGSNAGLWLKSIQHTGKSTNGTPVAPLPPVTFEGKQMDNRVDKTGDSVPPFIKWRVRKVTSETGSVLTVNYSDPECIADTNIPTALDKNTKRCYPLKWIPPSNPTPGTDPQPRTDWFHKYVVTQVTESDPTGGAPLKETNYIYDPAGGAWAYDDQSPINQDKYRTWGTWRGYQKVTTLVGAAESIRSKTVSLYYRGMDGDKQLDGTTRVEKVTDSTGTVTDSEQYAGQTREQVTYNGTTGSEVSGTITTPASSTTATASHSYGTVRAFRVRTQTQTTRVPVAGTADMTSRSTTTYDSKSGLPLTVETEGGGKKDCTVTSYAQNTTAWILDKPKQVEKLSVGCGVAPKRTSDPATTDVISDTRTSYDGQAWGSAPTKGDLTATARVTGYNADGTAQTPQAVSKTAYDALGRVTDQWDAKDTLVKHVDYTPAAGGPLASTKQLNALGHTVTTEFYSDWGMTKASVDPNNRRTEMAYDALGRLSDVWLADRPRTETPSKKIEYKIQQGKASWVATKSLNNDGTTYQTAYTIYDALLRPRQTQTPAVGAGRVIAETKYDTRGLAVETAADFIDTTAPTGDLANLLTAAPGGTQTIYDGAGRPAININLANGKEHSRTTTTYEGNATTVEPPAGASAVREQVDSRGMLTEKREYEGNKATGASTTLTYTYGRADQLTKVQDSDGNAWKYEYDFLGRKTSTTDPDTGTTKTEYNELDQVVVTEDPNGKILSYTYDALGRKTGKLRDRIPLVNNVPTIDETKYLARWSYDTIAKGRPTSSIRYDGGKTGKVYAITNAAYDPLYRVTKEQYTISTLEGAVAGTGTYTITNAYNVDGTLQQRIIPAMGGLAQEILTYGYNSQRLPTKLQGLTGIVQDTRYLPAGERILTTLGVSSTAKWVDISQSYETGTKRLARQSIASASHSGTDADVYYSYDPAGNPVEIEDKSTVAGDRQCYAYDGHSRLKTAWTATADCTTAPTTETVGGVAPYWQSFTYDTAGNRKTVTDHLAQDGPATTTYTYDQKTTDGTVRPHLLSNTVAPPDSTTTPTTNYTYDKAGNTETRTTKANTQTLTWGPENDLTKVSDADGSATTYLNDSDGNRLIRRDKAGSTLYLGETELRYDNTTKAVTATRYYSHAGQTVAVRTPQNLTWLGSDHNGTASVQIDATTQALTRRYTQPFGENRGTAPTTWVGEKGFVGGTEDPTGLTHLGAREYDRTTGRFISADPIADLKDPQQINGYAYSNNNPVTFADPDGKWFGAITKRIRAVIRFVTAYSAFRNGTYSSLSPSYWAKPFGTGNYGTIKDLNSPGPCLSCKSAGDWKDYGAGYGNYVASSLDSAVMVNPWCWIESCGGYEKKYDEVAGQNGIDTNSELYEQGAHDAWFISVIAGGAGLVKSLLGGARKIAPSARKSDDAPLPKPGCNKCFLAGTAVLMGDGRSKPIEKVKVGDEVIATDPVTGKSGPRKVTRLIITENDKHFNELTIATKVGLRKLTATHEHPFWSPSGNRWVEARHLKQGMTLLSHDGATVTVQSNRPFSKHARTYNLTVDDIHTYYVLAGETPVLVHNSSGCPRFVDGDIWDDAFEVSGQTVETMATARISGDTLHLDGFMVFPKGTEGLSRAPVGPDALNQMKHALATRAHAEGFRTVVLNYERHIPKPDGTIFKRPGSMTLDVGKILGGG